MNKKELYTILNDIKENNLSVDSAMDRLKELPFKDLGYAKLDFHREIRNGFPEVIYCESKTTEHIVGIISTMFDKKVNILGTRISKKQFKDVKDKFPQAIYYEKAKVFRLDSHNIEFNSNTIALVAAGTSDIAIAEEAAITCEAFGNRVERFYDVGVAGIHRLLASIEDINKSTVIISVAGMEGALTSVLGGLVDKPIISVPTSVGYGASFGGISALLTMLNSCASGVSVVNIDNGFGAGYMASSINRQIELAIKK